MVAKSEAADLEAARLAGRMERLEMMSAIGSQGLCDCPAWVVMELEGCECRSRQSATGGGGKTIGETG
ncbi:hypothetical protein KYK29_15325 [Shinella daejeonensis]|uniref:hypothetical protein n=1 Tax=Shinella daejeonensis TaxID=659017 RepID=UPI0020C76202|nr:hypothetical protein [Shinella daejeonensis]MCP8896300.1 hypothetical protein [Shinella daejeonensis]